MQHERLGVILETYYSLYPEKKNAETVYCFFDVIQVVPGQEYFNAMLFRDLVERHDVSHPRAVTDLAHWLVANTAQSPHKKLEPGIGNLSTELVSPINHQVGTALNGSPHSLAMRSSFFEIVIVRNASSRKLDRSRI